MKEFAKLILAGISGTAVMFIVVGITEYTWINFFPRPVGISSDPAALTRFFESLPLPAWLMMFGNLLAATFIGGWTACRICPQFKKILAGLIGFLVLMMYFMNSMTIPYPFWLSILSVIGVPAVCYLVARVAVPEQPDS